MIVFIYILYCYHNLFTIIYSFWNSIFVVLCCPVGKIRNTYHLSLLLLSLFLLFFPSLSSSSSLFLSSFSSSSSSSSSFSYWLGSSNWLLTQAIMSSRRALSLMPELFTTLLAHLRWASQSHSMLSQPHFSATSRRTLKHSRFNTHFL